MNLVGARARGRACGWPGSCTRTCGCSSDLARSRGDDEFAARVRRPGGGAAGQHRGARLGRRAGTAGPTSTTARRWVLHQRGMPDRLHQPELGGPLGGRGPRRAHAQAMAAVDKLLVDRDAGLVKLLDPPFDTSALEPGYIKGYVPGVRENGGQYTHAAIWAAMAFALLGDDGASLGALPHAQPHRPRRRGRGRRGLQGRAVRHVAPTSMARRRTPGAADGPGTRAPPAGCTGWPWRR